LPSENFKCHELYPIPQRFSKIYTFDKKELGKGGFGIVFLVKNKESNEKFALKIIKTKKEVDEEKTKEIFEYQKKKNEISTKLNHKNIIKFYEVSDLPEHNVIIVRMEFAENGALSDLIKEKNMGYQQALDKI